MNKLDWIAVGLAVAIVTLGAAPSIATHYQFRPGSGPYLMMLLLLGAIVLGLWYYLVHYTYDKPKFNRRKHKWEEPDDED